jgi:hypothetical protein
MPPLILVGRQAPPPTETDQEMTFQTFRTYLLATCAWATEWYPHPDGLLAGVAGAVKAARWRAVEPAGDKALTAKVSRHLRNAWTTEVLLSAPRALGDPDLVAYANLWAPVQAYYAVFNALTAMANLLTADPPGDHAALLSWAARAAGLPRSPFVPPFAARVTGCEGAWTYPGFPGLTINERISNLSRPTAANAPSLLALGLRTTRAGQARAAKAGWSKTMKPTVAGKPRKVMPRAEFLARTRAMRPTTLFDLLWRLRVRANYQEGDAFLSGLATPTEAADFHAAFCDIVAATLLTVEVYVAHRVGRAALLRLAGSVPIPAALSARSVATRTGLW